MQTFTVDDLWQETYGQSHLSLTERWRQSVWGLKCLTEDIYVNSRSQIPLGTGYTTACDITSSNRLWGAGPHSEIIRCYLMRKQLLWIKQAFEFFFFLPLLSGLSSSSGCGRSSTWRGSRLPRPGNCSCQRCRDAKRREWASGFWGTPCEHDTVKKGNSKLLLFVDYHAFQVFGIAVWESAFIYYSTIGIMDSYSEDLVESWISCLLFHGCFPFSQISFVRNQVAFDIPSKVKSYNLST